MRAKSAPKVSVLTPIYNTNPEYLRECIESILNQTFTDFEFIILNDSPDNKEIEKIVKSYKDQRIKYYKNEKNIGISASRNKLLDLATGEYIAIFDHDDISVPTRLEKEVKYLDENEGVGVVSGNLEYFGEKHYTTTHPEYDHQIKASLTDNCYVAHTAAMIRKSVLDENNIKYEGFYSPCEDYQLWNRLMSITHFYNIQEALVRYRCIEGNTSHNQQRKMDINHDIIALEIRNKFPIYYKEFRTNQQNVQRTVFRLHLFNCIPLLKIKKQKIYLFGFIPVLKIRWK